MPMLDGVAPPSPVGSAMRPAEAPPPEFSECYAARFSTIAAHLAVYLGSVEEAQEVTQEAFTRADRISRYDDPGAWVRRVAWNLATSRLRRARTALRHWRTQRLEPIAGPGPDGVALTRALAALPANQRRAVVLHYLAGLPV